MLDQELSKIGIVAGRLAAGANLTILCPCDSDNMRDYLLHRSVSFVENFRHDFAVAINTSATRPTTSCFTTTS